MAALLIPPITQDYSGYGNLPMGYFNSARVNVWVADEAANAKDRASKFMGMLPVDSRSWDWMQPYMESKGGEWWVVSRIGSIREHGYPAVWRATEDSRWYVRRLSPKRHQNEAQIEEQVREYVLDYFAVPERQSFVWYKQRDAFVAGAGRHSAISWNSAALNAGWWSSLVGISVGMFALPVWIDRYVRRRRMRVLLLSERCPYCKYDLSGTVASNFRVKCPECGNESPSMPDVLLSQK